MLRRLMAISAFVVAAGCGGGTTTAPAPPVTPTTPTPAPVPEPTPEPSPAPTPAPTPADAAVTILAGARNLGNRAYSPSPITVVTGQSDCDFFLPPTKARPREKYIIFLTKTESGITANRCLGSALVSAASNQLKTLRGNATK